MHGEAPRGLCAIVMQSVLVAATEDSSAYAAAKLRALYHKSFWYDRGRARVSTLLQLAGGGRTLESTDVRILSHHR